MGSSKDHHEGTQQEQEMVQGKFMYLVISGVHCKGHPPYFRALGTRIKVRYQDWDIIPPPSSYHLIAICHTPIVIRFANNIQPTILPCLTAAVGC